MPFTIIRSDEQIPSYPALSKLAAENHVCVVGNEQSGSFSCRGITGDYRFSDGAVLVKFAGRGVTGEFSFANGNATVTVFEKPFWLPELLVRQKIAEELEALFSKLA